jgi:hypothetical protein
MKKIRCDILDVGDRIIVLLEYLSKNPKIQENPMYRLKYNVCETRKEEE